MKNRFFIAGFLLILLVFLVGHVQATSERLTDPPALIYVNLSTTEDINRFAATQLPVVGLLESGILSAANRAGQQALENAGLNYTVLDPDLHPGTYYLAQVAPSRQAPDYASFGLVLLDTGNGTLLRMDPSRADALARAGAELQVISITPKPLPSSPSQEVIPNVIDPDPIIQGMIDQVTQAKVSAYDQQLAGAQPVWVDGGWYSIPSRYTYSLTAIQKTTSFVGQHLQSLGLNVEYQQWGAVTYPNVIGEIRGSANPDDIFIIGAHIDDVSITPGADDNASGSVATLLAADILSQYRWSCTLRFAFWTGEEQGLLGSNAYAHRAHDLSESILGYLNLDMLAWNTLGSPPGMDIIYNSGMLATQQMAQLFTDVISIYDLNLITELRSSLSGASDHSSFWSYGYPAILSTEDQSDFNPYYHKASDTPTHTNLPYFTDLVKASIATYAHMSNCLVPSKDAYLDGYVTSASDGSPVAGATVNARSSQGTGYPATALANGYYALTLPADTYTVTASANGYEVFTMSDIKVAPDLPVVLNISLQPVCQPVNSIDFTWLPLQPFNRDPVIFTATADGSGPINYQWDFGDNLTGIGTPVNHTFIDPGSYTVTLFTANACGETHMSKNISIREKIGEAFLPLMGR